MLGRDVFFILACTLVASAVSFASPAVAADATDTMASVLEGDHIVISRAGDIGVAARFDSGREPSLSPDGKQLVYWQTGHEMNAPLMLADLDTGTSRLFLDGNLRSPRYSPDGKWLIFGQMVDHRWSVMITSAAAPRPRLLFTAGDEDVFHASWQPDGRGILASSLDELYFVDIDGKLQRRVKISSMTHSSSGSSANQFRLSPTAPQRLLFSGQASMSREIVRHFKGAFSSSVLFVYDLGTQKLTRLTDPSCWASAPAWSRDGRHVYFHGVRAADASGPAVAEGIMRIDADGSHLVRLRDGNEPAL